MRKTRIFYAYKNIRQMKVNTTKFPFSFIKLEGENNMDKLSFQTILIINQGIIEFSILVIMLFMLIC